MKRWLKRLGLGCFIGMASLSCKRILPMHPGFGIEIGESGGRYLFSFSNCLNDAPLPLDEVSIYEDGDGAKDLPAVCRLTSTSFGQQTLKVWEYGTAPPGYKLATGCRGLERGRAYDAHAMGSGVGIRRFQLRKDGSVETLEPACK